MSSGRSMETLNTESFRQRRSKHRFPIQQDVQYRVVSRNHNGGAGVGTTIDMSSHEVRFTTPDVLPIGVSIEVSVNWPAKIANECPLKLMIFGSVLRSDHAGAVVLIERYEFRTRR